MTLTRITTKKFAALAAGKGGGVRSAPARPLTVCLSALVLAFSLSLAAQQKQKSSAGKDGVYAPLAKTPAKALASKNPLKNDPDAVTAGEKLFGLHCAECHGDMAQGGRKGPSLLVSEVQQAPPGALFWILSNGVVRRGMPVWSKLPEPQRWQIVSYIKSLSPSSQAPADGWKPPSDPDSTKK